MPVSDRIKILVVDNDPAVLQNVTRGLRQGGFAVDAIPNGEAALQSAEHGDHHLVLADVQTPDLSGIALLEALKSRKSKLPVLLMTAQGSVSGAVEAMRKGASDYLLKPLSVDMLNQAVRRALNGRLKGEPLRRPCEARQIPNFVTRDPVVSSLLDTAGKLARSQATVLILGESGTGKECLARYIHSRSEDPGSPYIAVNCAALPETLAESELFGYEKGAFTGALSRKAGKFEMAGHGTLLLDEISEMALPLQAKLLRVLQERQIDRVGGGMPISLTARIIAVSNVDLEAAVREGKFRKDLFFRINVVPLRIPSLAERRGDIPLLVDHFIEKYSRLHGRPMRSAAPEALEALMAHEWPGNVRELENAVERAVLLNEDRVLRAEHLTLGPAPSAAGAFPVQAGVSVREMERRLIMTTLGEVNQNRARAAEMLGISIRTLRNKLKEYRENQAPGVP
ncbi:MAG: sigma-54-dependent transcriptional regulator [Desulfobacterales bacterium]